ncbi:hypothetical protein AB1L42_11015 [Thalassoglobus sp. JC818]|uniref:hypothetical protein n=1 Tax=Thalassoglobus sp. JC818 TaxID=3232136 RepID=UPI00345999F4
MQATNSNTSKRRFSPTASAVSILLCLVGAILALNLRDDGQLNAEPPATLVERYTSPAAKQVITPQPAFEATQLTQATPPAAPSGFSAPNLQSYPDSGNNASARNIHREIAEFDESLWETEQALLREKITQLRQRLAEIENKFHERERQFQATRRNQDSSLSSPVGLPLGPPHLNNRQPSPSRSQQSSSTDPFAPAQPVQQQPALPRTDPQGQAPDPFANSLRSQQEWKNSPFDASQQQQPPFWKSEEPTATPHKTPFLAQEIEHEETIENGVEHQQRTDFADEKSRQLAIEILGLEVQRAQQRLESARESVEDTRNGIFYHLKRLGVPESLQSESHERVPSDSRMELRKSEEQLIDAEIELKRALLQQQQALAQRNRNQENVGGVFTFTPQQQSPQHSEIDRELLVLDVEQAKFELETAETELERVSKLFKTGVGTQQDLTEAASRKHSAEIALRRAELLLKRSDLQQGLPEVFVQPKQNSEDQVPTQEPLDDAAPEPDESPSLDLSPSEEPAPEDTVPDQYQDTTSDTIQQTELKSVPSNDLFPIELSLSP